MFSSKRTTTCAFIFASFLSSLFDVVQASSLPKPPLGHVEHPVVRSLDVFPRRGAAATAALKKRRDAPELHHTDSFRLTLSAFDETYHLHLKPNDDLIHPAARINYYRPGPDGGSELYRTEPLLRESVRAYQGEVVRADDFSAIRRLQEDAAGGLYRRYDDPLPSNVLGWARIIVHSEGDPVTGEPPSFEGAFSINGDIHHVSAYDTYIRTRRSEDALPRAPVDPLDRHLVIYRNSDSVYQSEEQPQSCAHDSLAWNTDPTVNPALRPPTPAPTWYDSLLPANFTRRDDMGGNSGGTVNNFASSIGQTEGCPKTQQIVYMGVAADCKYVSNYQSPQNATKAILNDWNTATGKYKTTFNVSLGIVQLDVHDVVCPLNAPQDAPWNVDCSTKITLNDRLSLFSAWRGQQKDNIGLWHLMSGCPTGTEVGVAWLSTLCVREATGNAPNVVSGTAVSTFGMTEWEVVAHEIGHNFGAIHDCTSGCTLSDACCPSSATQCANPSGQVFIMNPTSSQSETFFSPCSIGNICTSLKTIDATCMEDASSRTQSTITTQMCGNGIVEDGEECDPGLGANSPCCDAATCKFRANAKCDPASSSCCTTGCQFAPSGTVCRPAMDAQCDVAETCSGTNAQCPADKTMPNGQKCGTELGETLTCASGVCTSVGQQCRMVGASLNLTRACQQQSQTGCQVSCQDPDDSTRCLVLQATLPSGSACGFGGTCSNGACIPGSLMTTAKAWFLQNLQISIPITVVAGIVILLMVWGLISALRRCCFPKSGPNATRRSQPMSGGRRPDSQEGLLAAPVTMPQATHGRSRSTEVTRAGRFPHALNPPRGGQSADFGRNRSNWVDDTMYNGPRRR